MVHLNYLGYIQDEKCWRLTYLLDCLYAFAYACPLVVPL